MQKLTVCLLLAAALFAQSDKKKLVFEVVSVRPHKPSGGTTSLPRNVAGRFHATNVYLRQLITKAYVDIEALLPYGEISGLPGWADAEGFDIQAQAEAGSAPTNQQTMEMLQSMLEDRFKLKIRRDTKSTPIYALVIDSGGFKLQEQQTSTGPTAPPRPGQLLVPNIQMLATALSRSAGRKVVDKTGLAGFYKISLSFRPDTPQPGVEYDPDLPSLFTAVREQLGLRLVPETGQVDTFVVESVQRPTEN